MVKRSNAGEAPPRGSVRIIAGDWRGRRVPVVPDSAVRPTPDRVRETLFNWLRDKVPGARCLDLFAGTGVLGFEALSRGAAEVWFVERENGLAAAIEAQAAIFDSQPRVLRQDAAALLAAGSNASFDIVFLDPPYKLPLEPLLALLPAWLEPGALVYVERPRSPGLPAVSGAEWWKRSRAGTIEYGLLRFTATAG